MSGLPTVGDAVPVLEKTATVVDLIAYAGATWDWHRIHFDPDFVAAKKLPAPLVDGQVYGAWFVQQLQDWLGPRCFVESLAFSFKNLMFAGETMRCEGVVTAVEGARVTLDLTGPMGGREGTPDRAGAAPVTAVVLVGRADGPAA